MGIPAQGLMVMGKHGNFSVELGAVTGVSESWVGRTKGKKKRGGMWGFKLLLVLSSVGLCRANLTRSSTSEPENSQNFSALFFPKLCVETCLQ